MKIGNIILILNSIMKNNQNVVVLLVPTAQLDFMEYCVLSHPKNVKKFSSNSNFCSPKMKLQSSDDNRIGNLFKEHLIFTVEGDLNLLNLKKNLPIWNQ